MKLIKVAAGVLNQTPLDWDANRDHIVAAIEQARQESVSILCLPELCITGYGCEDAFQSPGVQQMAQTVLLEILPTTQGMIVSLGLPLYYRGGLFNTACLAANGRLLGLVAKQNLAGEGLHYEPRWFKAWPEGVRAEVDIGPHRCPLGDWMFDCGGVRIGFEICEDAWVANRPGGELAQQGVDILLNPSASHFAFRKHGVRRGFVLNGSRAFAVSYVYANLLGNEAGRAIYDGDAMIASNGKLLSCGPRFSFEDSEITSAVIDVDATRMCRARTGNFRFEINDDSDAVVRADFDFPAQATVQPADMSAHWESSEALKEEEFARAIALGLFDYLRKSQSRGFVVSLSGGADSAAVATLAGLMVHFGVGQLGRERFLEKLSFIESLSAAKTNGQLVNHLLTCVYQSTRNSSETTHDAARGVAEGLGARFLKLDVDATVQNYLSMVTAAVGRQLTWERDDLALQNIQARARGPSVWLLANLTGSLLLATSNRSEAAVGYATMDGDTCGGLSPIAGIDKAFLCNWLRWMEHHGPADGFSLTQLSAVNEQAPTAELRPLETRQTDEEDLMPYDLLDAIERCAIRDKQVPLEVFQIMSTRFSHYSPQQLATWVERFFQLWCRNQWKRERYAPSFHVDDENLDPKTWCRFPILSGGYRRELRELRQHVSGLEHE